MVLTRSMSTINDSQEEELPTTALEKQVKTLAAAVERLTKQNHDLEEQLRQKDAAPGYQGPSGSPRDVQDLDAPSRSSRRDHVQGLPYDAEGSR